MRNLVIRNEKAAANYCYEEYEELLYHNHTDVNAQKELSGYVII